MGPNFSNVNYIILRYALILTIVKLLIILD